MATLNKDLRGAVNDVEAASGGFALMDPHELHYVLRDVDPTREGPKGPYWVWEYECIEAPYKGRRMWNNTSLSKESLGFLKGTFEAFGVDADTDTDELIGKPVKLRVRVRTIQGGDRKGEQTNDVSAVLPADDDFEPDGDVTVAAGAKGGSEEDIF